MLKTAQRLQSAALTVAGRKRPANEDAVHAYTGCTPAGDGIGLYIVCDGMGGYKGGSVASRLAVEIVVGELLPLLNGDSPLSRGLYLSEAQMREHCVREAIERANATLRQRSWAGSVGGHKMGTTIVLALIMDGTAHVAHVGDSRAYLVQGERLIQMTRDHSLAAELAINGHITPSEIVDHPRNNVLLRAVGLKDRVEIDHFEWPLRPGDRLLLCSDGLWKAFPSPSDLLSCLQVDASPSEICARLVVEANRRDGSDNISAVVVSSAEVGRQQE